MTISSTATFLDLPPAFHCLSQFPSLFTAFPLPLGTWASRITARLVRPTPGKRVGMEPKRRRKIGCRWRSVCPSDRHAHTHTHTHAHPHTHTPTHTHTCRTFDDSVDAFSHFSVCARRLQLINSFVASRRYLQMCEEIGSQPLIGVNYFCSSKHESYCGTKNQSIAHAVKQVEFVVAHGFPGAFYYIVSSINSQLRTALTVQCSLLALRPFTRPVCVIAVRFCRACYFFFTRPAFLCVAAGE